MLYLDRELLVRAFTELDQRLTGPVTLIVGGGTAMMLAHGLPVRTTDVDAYPTGATLEAIDPAIKEVARRLGLPGDWINPHFATFAHVLPADYGSRLRAVFSGDRLSVQALGAEDLLIMKCFAGRAKDIGHAKALLRCDPDLSIVEARLHALLEKRIPGAREALDFLDDVSEQ